MSLMSFVLSLRVRHHHPAHTRATGVRSGLHPAAGQTVDGVDLGGRGAGLDRVATALELGPRFRGEGVGLGLDPVGQPLVVEPRAVEGGLQGVAPLPGTAAAAAGAAPGQDCTWAEGVAWRESISAARRAIQAGARSWASVALVVAGSPSRKRSAKDRRSASASMWSRSAPKRGSFSQPSFSSMPRVWPRTPPP